MYSISEQSREQLMMRTTECWDDRSSIQQKIKLAREIYVLWREELRRDPSIRDLLEKLQKSIKASREAMLDLGIVGACKRCDEEEGGSCCGAGLENKFDTFLLLVNLLLGVSLPDYHRRLDSCYLLTTKGCMLKARLVLCVDFLCPKIIQALRHDELVRLQQISGEELVTCFMLYDAIKKFMRNSTRTNEVGKI